MVTKGSTTEQIEEKYNQESELAVVAENNKYAKGKSANESDKRAVKRLGSNIFSR